MKTEAKMVPQEEEKGFNKPYNQAQDTKIEDCQGLPEDTRIQEEARKDAFLDLSEGA